MKNLRIRSASEQLADFLKEEIRSRRWTGTMPGESWMVPQFQVGRDTVRAAGDHAPPLLGIEPQALSCWNP